MITLKDMVKGTKVRFVWYANGELWYAVDFVNPESGENNLFEFPVPISDVGEATFHAEDKAMLFMRYIRKHLDWEEEQNAQAESARQIEEIEEAELADREYHE